MARPRNTLDYIRLHARRRPQHPAVLTATQRVGYARLHDDLRQMVAALAQLEVPPGDLVAVGLDSFYLQLLVVLGFEALGVTTGSFRPGETGAEWLFAKARLVVAGADAAELPGRRLLRAPPNWLQQLRGTAAVLPPLPAPAGAQGAVLLRSSGTTGTPKPMLMNRHILGIRIRRRVEDSGFSRTSRYLALMHPTVSIVYQNTQACLRLGATVASDHGMPLGHGFALFKPTHTTILPYHLGRILALPSLPPGSHLPGLRLAIAGGAFPDSMRRAALARLCGTVVNRYSSNESGMIGAVGEDGIIQANRGMQAEVVGEDGAPAGTGEVGHLRFRGAGILSAYLDNPEATARVFRDGWFYPGDLGRMVAPGRFRLLGRDGDVVNLSGIKMACDEVENTIRAAVPVADVAVIHGMQGGPLTVCVVPAGNSPRQGLGRAIEPVLGVPFNLWITDAVPRTPEGKVKRGELRRLVEARQAPAGKPAAAGGAAAAGRVAGGAAGGAAGYSRSTEPSSLEA